MTAQRSMDARALLEAAGARFRSDGFHLYFKEENTAVIRFAGNDLTNHLAYADSRLTLKAYRQGREGTATVNRPDDASVRAGVLRAEEAATLAPVNPEYVGPPRATSFPDVQGYDPAAAASTPADRVSAVKGVVAACKERGLKASGSLQVTDETAGTWAGDGAPALHRNTTVQFSVTARTEDGTGSGWVLRWASALADLDIDALAETAMAKAEASRNPQPIEAGRYTVVLEPVACEYLLYCLTEHLDARAAEEGRSFPALFDAAGKPAGTRRGERLMSPLFTMRRQVGHPSLGCHPFDENGSALTDVAFVKDGVLENLGYDAYWAKKNSVAPTGELRGIVMEGSKRSVADLVKGVDRGLLVTRLWYIRDVDFMKSSVTGMTRDGTFRIEGGEVAGPVKNLRFNDEVRRIFRDMTAASAPERFWDYLSPGIVVPEFQFTSTTESV